MRIPALISPSPTACRRRQRAFTMIEIALAVGVIGFALVAIIGILPAGMNVQKDNRDDTIVSQDAPYFINAIRDGEMRTNHNILAEYVEAITNASIDGGTNYLGYQNPMLLGGASSSSAILTNDLNIIGLLSAPLYDLRPGYGTPPNVYFTNQMTAVVRAMTGNATEQNGSSAATAFRYALTVQIYPWTSVDYDSINYLAPGLDALDVNARSNRLSEAAFLTSDLHELRLTFAWPVLPNGNVGPHRQVYRTLIAGDLMETNIDGGPDLWFFQPQSYTNNSAFNGTGAPNAAYTNYLGN